MSDTTISDSQNRPGPAPVRMFHAKDGHWFCRHADGSVEVREERNGVISAVHLDASTWCSVIATMSRWGEDNGGYERAVAFHADSPSPHSVS